MCLAIPVKITKIEGQTATVDAGGVQTQANIQFLDNLKIGDYVIVHAGFAIQKLDEEQALKTLDDWREINEISG